MNSPDRVMATGAPTLWIVAGANGVGKTTFAASEIIDISGSASFVNLDLIAQGISPLDPGLQPVLAARIALDMMRDFVSRRATFSIETTLAGKGHKGLITNARENGYAIRMLYFYVSSLEETLRRIAKRVAEGGHDVPQRDAVRRYSRSLAQFGDYALLCDHWRIYDSDDPTPRPRASGAFGAVEFEDCDSGRPLPPDLAAWLESALRNPG